MLSDEQLCMARKVLLQKTNDRPVVISQGDPEQCLDTFSSVTGPSRRPHPCPRDATCPRFSRKPPGGYDCGSVNAPFLQHAYSASPLGRNREDEFSRYHVGNGDPFTDDKCPWTPPASKWVPPPRPTDRSLRLPYPFLKTSSPVNSPSLEHQPRADYFGWPGLSQAQLLKKNESRGLMGCGERHYPLRSPVALTDASEGQRKARENVAKQAAIQDSFASPSLPAPRRLHPPHRSTGPDLRASFKEGVATPPMSADYSLGKRDPREQHQYQRQNRAQEQSGKAENEQWRHVDQDKKQDYVPDWLKALLRIKQERPGPDKVFNKDFNFGPRSKDANGEWSPAVSPLSLSSSLPDLHLNVQNESLKRQRHDSSNADMARVSFHGHSYSTGSLVQTEQQQSSLTTAKSKFGRLDAAHVHPGQLIDPPDMVGYSSDNLNLSISDFDLQDSASHVGGSSINVHVENFDYKTPVRRLSRDTTRSGNSLDSQTGRQASFSVGMSDSTDDHIRTITCGLQRRQRTMRPHSPFRTAPSTTTLTKSRTAEPSDSHRMSRRDWRRKRSYVPRCASADAFLRFVRDRPEVRRRVRERELKRESEESMEELETEWIDDRDWGGGVPL